MVVSYESLVVQGEAATFTSLGKLERISCSALELDGGLGLNESNG